jgi:DHA1 family bicyclomycin/chloramphenicol resistance-like MFS transporter
MLLLIAIIFTIILAGAEVDIFTPSFPELQRHFGLTPFMVQLTLSMNFVGYCASSLFVGPLGDRYGKRPIILGSLVIFIAGSILCLVAPTFWILILGRLLQGLGMSGPAVLAFVVIVDVYPLERQASLMGTMNGLIASSMALAPVIGSFVNLYYGWRGNFFILFAISIVSFGLCYWTLPHDKPNPAAKLSLVSYIPLMKSKLLMKYVFAVCLAISGYWVFIGISPILYMEDLSVKLEHFGFYQGVTAGAFALISTVSPMFLKRYGPRKCLKTGTIITTLSALSLLFTGIFIPDHPMIITVLMVGYTLGMVFPVNILYPVSLSIFPEDKGKAAALVAVGRLIIMAIALEFLGYIYNGTFYSLGIFIGLVTLGAFVIIRSLPEWKKYDDASPQNQGAAA